MLQEALLQRYNISLSDSTLKQLEEAPMAWAALQTKITMRHAATPFLLQTLFGRCALSNLQGEHVSWSNGNLTLQSLLHHA